MFSPFDKGVGIGYFAFCKAMESFLRRNFDTMHRVAVLDLVAGQVFQADFGLEI